MMTAACGGGSNPLLALPIPPKTFVPGAFGRRCAKCGTGSCASVHARDLYMYKYASR